MFERELKVFTFLEGYSQGLLADLPADQFCQEPAPNINSPAWILGHLAYVADAVAGMFGGTLQLKDWSGQYGKDSKVNTDPAGNPTKEELLAAWRDARKRLADAVMSSDASAFEAPNPNERMKEALPTAGDFLAFILTGHEAMHLGQLSNCRRLAGKAPLF